MMLEKRFDKLQVPQQLPCGRLWAVIPHELSVRVVCPAQPEVISNHVECGRMELRGVRNGSDLRHEYQLAARFGRFARDVPGLRP